MKLKDVWNFYMEKEAKSKTVKHRKNTLKKKHDVIPKYIKSIRGKGSYWKKTRRLLANKFCNCIKKLEGIFKDNQGKSIGICTKSVYTSKGLKRKGQFSCKPNKVQFIINK